jgi:hypothetical protein
MNQSNEQLKQEVINQIKHTTDPIIKKVLEKRLKEIDKEVKK